MEDETEDENPPPKTLPADILLEIFSNLTFKSLLQFRCVSKSWHALISRGHSSKKLPLAMSGLFNSKNNNNEMRDTSLQSRTHIDSTSVDTSPSFLPSSLCNLLYCRMLQWLAPPHNRLLQCWFIVWLSAIAIQWLASGLKSQNHPKNL